MALGWKLGDLNSTALALLFLINCKKRFSLQGDFFLNFQIRILLFKCSYVYQSVYYVSLGPLAI